MYVLCVHSEHTYKKIKNKINNFLKITNYKLFFYRITVKIILFYCYCNDWTIKKGLMVLLLAKSKSSLKCAFSAEVVL